ncbi:hypothetical protein CL634_05970 [bacterium]|nr:hypothetical protein [bacterium]|tara:strand:+ start:3315 stop:3626 length:312 start_codon:yes stop_codon:yes gene_type:complete
MSTEYDPTEYTDEHVFENMDELFGLLVTAGILEQKGPRLSTFYILYQKINEGCKCHTKARLEQALEGYKDLKNLNLSAKMAMKRHLYVKKIVFKQNGEVLFEL